MLTVSILCAFGSGVGPDGSDTRDLGRPDLVDNKAVVDVVAPAPAPVDGEGVIMTMLWLGRTEKVSHPGLNIERAIQKSGKESFMIENEAAISIQYEETTLSFYVLVVCIITIL